MSKVEVQKENLISVETKQKISSDIELMKARIIVANKIPRSIKEVEKKFSDIFDNPSILKRYAKSSFSTWKLPIKGAGDVRGLTISTVTDLAGVYGHLMFGVRTAVTDDKNKVAVHAFCLDVSNNTSEDRVFTAELPDYVMNAKNFDESAYKYSYSLGMRRMRSCIEHTLPQWMKEEAMDKIVNAKRELYKDSDTRKDKARSLLKEFILIDAKYKDLKNFKDVIGRPLKKEDFENPEVISELEERLNGFKETGGFNTNEKVDRKKASKEELKKREKK